ncbi:CDC27 family protein [Ramlibacter rhizophilus]|uniref:Tetratricopeptide repeat protein n=1 Tax=Ramlibacter rhizophilus TaxID=1781167 RepID=A0A4Z0BGT9_9BURK|nr:CDC27 family protein [Ramlibacter rhizophilus]TFY98010.1 tetratricopeptide repeat protein [Ramlibacter rhizophilus]
MNLSDTRARASAAPPPPEPRRPAIERLVQAFLVDGLSLSHLRRISPEHLEARYEDARRRLMDGDAHEALPALAELVALNPWDARFEFAFGLALQLEGQHERAVPHYLQSLLLDPQQPGCALRLGECMERLGEHAAALEAYRRCLASASAAPADAQVLPYAQAGIERLARGAGRA